MSNLYDRIVNNRGSFEQLVARIPGFKGYQDKQARREADQQLRKHIADRVEKQVQRLVRLENLILDKLGMSYMTRTREAKGKIQMFHDKVNSATPGYSGMWAQMKIGSEELETIYKFDEEQINNVEKIDTALDKLESAVMQGEGVEEAIYSLDTVAQEAIDAFDMRDDVLTRFAENL